ncbi:NAD-dependent epimerase/dehydratase family protein [Amycolatopsis taiwanensis]|uniref:dTDP-glucose 4,6-dehydratase n=1 Tax=Amycolatopsis taiwanensis TaxID=342230 RepID=A0A9W6QZM1_9PSEU|nr:NAD(P)-dependent oxidoreductase [Amycolatopsis taiwanensis]GLY66618.1 dTDP-glucose 4,6-dehydratase [Amycolatopsis taiwanensis]
MKIILAGATGAVGAPIARALLVAGHQVIGLSRNPNGLPEGVQPLTADALDRDSVLRAARGIRADAVIHQLSALKKNPMRHQDMALTNRLRVEGTANLIALAREVGATRFLTQSMIFGYGYGDLGDQPLTETAPFGRGGRGRFAAHIGAMRSTEEQAFAIGGIALRYGIFYGAAEDPTVDMIRRGRLPVPKGGMISRIHLEDAATATVAALEHSRPGEAYNIVDDLPASWRDYFCTVAETHGAPAPKAIPAWVLKATPYLHAIFTANCRVSNAKAKSELGWAPRYPTYREGIAVTTGR